MALQVVFFFPLHSLTKHMLPSKVNDFPKSMGMHRKSIKTVAKRKVCRPESQVVLINKR